MPAELAWTRELPTKPGLYIIRTKRTNNRGYDVLRCERVAGAYRVTSIEPVEPADYTARQFAKAFGPCEWLGPLPE